MFQQISTQIQEHYKSEYENVPEKQNLIGWADALLRIIFPLHQPIDTQIVDELTNSRERFIRLLQDAKFSHDKAANLAHTFYEGLLEIHRKLLLDAEEVFNNDPAAKCMGEIIHTYPGFYAIAIYRIAHLIHTTLKIQYIPRMLSEHAHSKTGIDIHPGAQIQAPFFIDHGTGVVIGETCVIGKHVNIYQGVTLGAIQVEKDMVDTKRHPTIEDEVVIYANATILGGNTVVGNHSVIGGNVFLTQSVDPYSLVYTKPETQIKKIKSTKEPINFVI